MQVNELIANGNLTEALAEAKSAVKSKPADPNFRAFLAQLYAVTGDFDKAITQLDVASDMSPEFAPFTSTYRVTIALEAEREQVMLGQKTPTVLGAPEEWYALVFEALRLVNSGHTEQFIDVLGQAYEAAPLSAGQINGEAFEWIADGDSRIGPFLETISRGKYIWCPLHHVRKITTSAPADLCDLMWLPADLELVNGQESKTLLPARYWETNNAEDDALQLANKTEWQQLSDDYYSGIGQKVLVTDQNEYPLLECREITFSHATDD